MPGALNFGNTSFVFGLLFLKQSHLSFSLKWEVLWEKSSIYKNHNAKKKKNQINSIQTKLCYKIYIRINTIQHEARDYLNVLFGTTVRMTTNIKTVVPRHKENKCYIFHCAPYGFLALNSNRRTHYEVTFHNVQCLILKHQYSSTFCYGKSQTQPAKHRRQNCKICSTISPRSICTWLHCCQWLPSLLCESTLCEWFALYLIIPGSFYLCCLFGIVIPFAFLKILWCWVLFFPSHSLAVHMLESTVLALLVLAEKYLSIENMCIVCSAFCLSFTV